MAQEIQGQVGPQNGADGAKLLPRLDTTGAIVMKELTGRYAEAAERDELFICSTPAAGVTVPIFSNTNQQFVLYNPLASQFKYEILKAWLGYVSGTQVAGHICWGYQANFQATAITGTAGLAIGSRLMGTPGSLLTLTNATVVAFTYLRPWSYSQLVATAASALTPFLCYDETEGSIILQPGAAVSVAANVAAAMVATVGVLVRQRPVTAAS